MEFQCKHCINFLSLSSDNLRRYHMITLKNKIAKSIDSRLLFLLNQKKLF